MFYVKITVPMLNYSDYTCTYRFTVTNRRSATATRIVDSWCSRSRERRPRRSGRITNRRRSGWCHAWCAGGRTLDTLIVTGLAVGVAPVAVGIGTLFTRRIAHLTTVSIAQVAVGGTSSVFPRLQT